MILVIGSSDDLHVTTVIEALRRQGVEALLVDWASERHPTRLTLDPVSGMCRLDDRTLAADQVGAIWWRMKPRRYGLESAPEAEFRDREWLHALEGFAACFPKACWINPRAIDQRMRYKAVQLRLAAQIGLDVPRTRIGNDPSLRAHFEGRHIYKPLSHFARPPSDMLFTTDITDRDFRDADFRAAPGIYQDNVVKAYELRITAVGRTLFATRIDAIAGGTSEQDWRRQIMDVRYTPCDLPASLEDGLLRFHDASGLVYGAYDFIVTPDDRHVFLEVNPVGQWLWIEEITGQPISAAIAAALVGPDGGASSSGDTSG